MQEVAAPLLLKRPTTQGNPLSRTNHSCGFLVYGTDDRSEPTLFSNLSTCFLTLRAVQRLRLPWFSSSSRTHDGVGWVRIGKVEPAIRSVVCSVAIKLALYSTPYLGSLPVWELFCRDPLLFRVCSYGQKIGPIAYHGMQTRNAVADFQSGVIKGS